MRTWPLDLVVADPDVMETWPPVLVPVVMPPVMIIAPPDAVAVPAFISTAPLTPLFAFPLVKDIEPDDP
jgi:hypothetical protein